MMKISSNCQTWVKACTHSVVHKVYHVKRFGVFVKFPIDISVFTMCYLACLMQELVAFFKRGSCQQQTALLLVVVDVCFYCGNVAWNKLCLYSNG